MIKKVNETCEKMNKKLGVPISLPNPSKKTLKNCFACNLFVGVDLIMVGIVIKSKWCIILGAIGVISGGILLKESNK